MANTRTVVVTPTISQTLTVSDGRGCVQDSFVLTVTCNNGLFTLKPGNWTDPSVWSCHRLPTSVDVVQLKHPLVIPAGLIARAKQVLFEPGISIHYEAGGQLQLSTINVED
jgi:hypothetical protein